MQHARHLTNITTEDCLLFVFDPRQTLNPDSCKLLSLPNGIDAVYALSACCSQRSDYELAALVFNRPAWDMSRACAWLTRYSTPQRDEAEREGRPTLVLSPS